MSREDGALGSLHGSEGLWSPPGGAGASGCQDDDLGFPADPMSRSRVSLNQI